MAHQKLKSDQKNRPGGALKLRLRQYSERPLKLDLTWQVTLHKYKETYAHINQVDRTEILAENAMVRL